MATGHLKKDSSSNVEHKHSKYEKKTLLWKKIMTEKELEMFEKSSFYLY